MTPVEVAEEIGINLGSALIGSTVALGLQRVRRHQKNARRADFLGVNVTRDCLITLNISPRGVPSSLPGQRVITHNDVHAAVRLYRMLERLGGSVELCEPDLELPAGRVEFCIGGSRANSRTERLLKKIPGVAFMDALCSPSVPDPAAYPQDITTDDGRTRHTAELKRCEYAILARIPKRDNSQGHTFIVAGQTSNGNPAAVAYLEDNLDRLHREYGRKGFFTIVRMRDWDDNRKKYEQLDAPVGWPI